MLNREGFLAWCSPKARIICSWLAEVLVALANEKGPSDERVGLMAAAVLPD